MTTRLLGIQFLWVDSLCIIQDDPVDWKHEAARMGDIYAGSFCTLAASSSDSPSQGCRVNARKKGRAKNPRHIDLDFISPFIRIYETSPSNWNDEYQCNPIGTRAWTLQEKELSVRNIHFSTNLLLWECKTLKASSELPWHQMKIEDPPPGLLYNDMAETTNDGGLLVRQCWIQLIEEYSLRVMTRESDKLPALSGLAKEYQRGQYAAGMWENDMPAALLWRTKSPTESSPLTAFQPRRPMQWRAPTWSWASIDAPISYESQRISLPRGKDGSISAELDYGDFRILEINTTSEGLDPTGAVSAGHIRLHGRLAEVLLDYKTAIKDSYKHGGSRKLLAGDNLVGLVYPDVLIDLQFISKLYCVSIRREQDFGFVEEPHGLFDRTWDADNYRGSEGMVMGLALVPSKRMPGSFQRVGLVRWLKNAVFDDVQPSEIMIV